MFEIDAVVPARASAARDSDGDSCRVVIRWDSRVPGVIHADYATNVVNLEAVTNGVRRQVREVFRRYRGLGT